MALNKIGFLREREAGEDFQHWLDYSATRRCLHAVGELNRHGCFKCNEPRHAYCRGYWWNCTAYEPNLTGQIEINFDMG